jgi:hypothetical protein
VEHEDNHDWVEDDIEMFNDINPPSAISDHELSRVGLELMVRGTQMKIATRNDGHIEQYI